MPTLEEFRLPDVGEGLTEADVVAWSVGVGDDVEVNQVIVEIETAKSVVELPSPWSGRVHALLADAGATVQVGDPIIVIDVDPDGAQPEPKDSGAADVPGSGGDAGPDDAGPDDAEPSGGVLVGYGTRAAARTRRSRRVTERAGAQQASAPAAAGPAAPAAGPGARPPRPASAPSPSAPRAGATSDSRYAAERGSEVLAKPPVRKLAKDLGVDLAAIASTGPGGIITREDVVAHAGRTESRDLASYPGDESWLADGVVSPDGRQTRVPVRSVRKRTAEAMVNSAFTAPHVTVFHTLDVTRTMELVAKLKDDRTFADVKVTPLLIAAKALLLAVRRHPEINASWDDEAQEIAYKHYVNLGIAASTPRGLVVPNIKDAHRLSLHSLAVGINELTATARAGRTSVADMSDGTITVTNVGVFGIDSGTPILNPGESAILAFGAIRKKPWVVEDRVEARWVTQLALSFDHRLVDGVLGAQVLADVATVLEDPDMALVWG